MEYEDKLILFAQLPFFLVVVLAVANKHEKVPRELVVWAARLLFVGLIGVWLAAEFWTMSVEAGVPTKVFSGYLGAALITPFVVSTER